MRWYPDDERYKSTPRVVEPAREYRVHLAGILLTVKGLAWQQQDTGVGACATIGLWTMLHSSAFDDHHAIPTTADITREAHNRASLGTRMFPSTGLTLHQICEAVKEQNLAPVISEGDIQNAGNVIGFSKERFAASCASFIKLAGYLTNELANTLGANPKLLGQVRMALAEDVPPMSLHIGVVRIGLDNSTPLIDILYDTTDSDRNHPVYAHVAYSSFMKPLIAQLEKVGVDEYGVCVEAF